METNKQGKMICFFAFDALGHIHPIISIGKELKLRGHRVALITLRRLSGQERFQGTGIEFHHCIEIRNRTHRDNEAEEDVEESEQKHNTVMTPLKKIFRQGATKAFEATYGSNGVIAAHIADIELNHQSIEDKLRSFKPDLIVVDFLTGIPCTTYVAPKWVRLYSAFPSVLYSAQDNTYVAGRGLSCSEMKDPKAKQLEIDTKTYMVNKIKSMFLEKGLEIWDNDIEIAPSSPHLNFFLNPKEICPNSEQTYRNLDSTWLRLEHTIDEHNSSNRFEIPGELRNLPGKLIYFSLGTLVTSDTELINRLLGFLSKSLNRFIVSKGQLHEQIHMYPNMWGDKFLDQKAILPQVDLFITHGGNNSVIEAFYYGVGGLIVLPVFADQFDSAQRIHETGFGIRLNPYECNEKQLLDSIESLLANQELINSNKLISKRLQSIEYHKIAATQLESLVK